MRFCCEHDDLPGRNIEREAHKQMYARNDCRRWKLPQYRTSGA
jgi:hypothetical protein